METKKCNKCGVVKNVSDFHIESRAKNGYKPRCKSCSNEYYNSLYPSFKSAKSEQQKKYYQQNSDTIKKRVADYFKKNSESIIAKKLLYVEKNRLKINKFRNEYTKKRNATDAEFRANRTIRSFIYRLLISKTDKTKNILGYSVTDLYKSLGRYPDNNESIDHKIPISWFNTTADIRIIHNLKNLQIVTKSYNSKKLNTYCDPISNEYYQIALKSIKPKYQQFIKTTDHDNTLESSI